ncbi:hypothetical protein Bca4012_027175 [Brassica carinata]|uniref:Uncharacterized protein n=1 Tax=Brassica carinata TaxID=52824 RepID=A0A8X7VK46_BRACI|nr:hypothetical protein Bca52824_024170 [Brassica carinata]
MEMEANPQSCYIGFKVSLLKAELIFSFNEDKTLRSSRVNYALGNTASQASNLVHATSSEHSESQEVVRSSDHQARNIPRQGKIKEKSGAEEPNTSAMSESECADSEAQEIDKSQVKMFSLSLSRGKYVTLVEMRAVKLCEAVDHIPLSSLGGLMRMIMGKC